MILEIFIRRKNMLVNKNGDSAFGGMLIVLILFFIGSVIYYSGYWEAQGSPIVNMPDKGLYFVEGTMDYHNNYSLIIITGITPNDAIKMINENSRKEEIRPNTRIYYIPDSNIADSISNRDIVISNGKTLIKKADKIEINYLLLMQNP